MSRDGSAARVACEALVTQGSVLLVCWYVVTPFFLPLMDNGIGMCYAASNNIFRRQSMAGRRKKNMTLDEELAYLEADISKKEEELKGMKARKKELNRMKEEADLKLLYDGIKASGKTVDEFLESMNKGNES